MTEGAGAGRAGAAPRAARSRIGMVFQHFNLLSSRTVQGNVELPLEILGLSGRGLYSHRIKSADPRTLSRAALPSPSPTTPSTRATA
ncbi:hypothetical protein [Actinacidiphila oryziradicis]|uniref:hypothetical protein n=1 Tax=Actinacidiphila oryziradicis TaxID=2571141 RepID=UPI00268E756A